MIEVVIPQSECSEHDMFWAGVGRESAWTCKKCGFSREAVSGREVQSSLSCFTAVSGMPDGVLRHWWPTFPLEYLDE